MDKQGKVSGGVIALTLIGLAIVGILAYVAFLKPVPQTTLAGGEGGAIATGGIGTTTCAGSNPVVNATAVDPLNAGTIPALTNYYKKNGVYSGGLNTGSFTAGDKAMVLSDVSNYISVVIPEFSVNCGDNTKEVKIYAETAPGMKVFNDGGDQVTNTTSLVGGSAGQINQSSVTAGGSATLRLRLTGTSQKTTGDQVVVFETGSTTNITSIKLYDVATGSAMPVVANPRVYTPRMTGGYEIAFKVPALVDAQEKDYSFTIQSATSYKWMGSTNITTYGGETFVDTNGDWIWGIENSIGTAKYENTNSMAFFTQAS